MNETWATTNMARRHGRAPQSVRLVHAAPHGPWKTIPFTAALTASGMTALMTLHGAMTGDRFLAYVWQVLVLAVRPGRLVVMDNLSCHKRVGVREAIDAAGRRLLNLPPCSPDLNPIEQAFAKLESLPRR